MDGLIAYALAKKYADKVGQSILDAGFKVQVEQDRSILNRTGEQMTLYLLPKESSLSSDAYDEYVYTTRWEQVGSTDIELDYTQLQNLPILEGKKNDGSIFTQTLEDELSFSDRDFYVNDNSTFDKHIITIDRRYFRYIENTPISDPVYDFNNISSPRYYCSGVLRFESAQHTTNFPSALADIDRSQPHFVVQYFGAYYTNGNGAWYLRKVVGKTLSGKYVEYAQMVKLRKLNPPYETYRDPVPVVDQTSWQKVTNTEIVSGVVNQNGTITFTDSDDNAFTTTGDKLMTSGNQQISMGYDNGGFYFLFDDGQEVTNNGSN